MEDKFKLKLYSCIYLHSTYQTQTMGMRIHDILFFVSVLGKSLKNLVGKRLQDRGKVTSNLEILFKFNQETTQFAKVLDFLMPVSLNRSLTLL